MGRDLVRTDAADRGDRGSRRADRAGSVLRTRARGREPGEDGADLVALDLARRRARQRRLVQVDDRGALRRRRARRSRRAGRLRARSFRVVRSSADAGTARHARRSPPRVSTPTIASSAISGNGPEPALDVVGVHVLAVRRDDHVLEAPEDLEAPLPVDAPEVPRVQPALGVDGLARRLRVGVADHDVGAPRDHLADAAARRRPRCAARRRARACPRRLRAACPAGRP